MNNQKLLEFFQRIHMADNDKDFWMVRLENLPENIQGNIIGLFELYPESMQWFRAIQEKKERVLADFDWSKWRTIIEEEENFFTSLRTST